MPRLRPDIKGRLEDTRRSQILAAAALIFARKGFDRATIAEIVQAAGLVERGVYNNFRSKDELLAHIPRQLAQPVLTGLLDRLPSPASAEEMEAFLLQLGTAFVERVRTHRRLFQVFFSALPPLSPAGRNTYLQLVQIHAVSRLERLLRDGVRARPDDRLASGPKGGTDSRERPAHGAGDGACCGRVDHIYCAVIGPGAAHGAHADTGVDNGAAAKSTVARRGL